MALALLHGRRCGFSSCRESCNEDLCMRPCLIWMAGATVQPIHPPTTSIYLNILYLSIVSVSYPSELCLLCRVASSSLSFLCSTSGPTPSCCTESVLRPKHKSFLDITLGRQGGIMEWLAVSRFNSLNSVVHYGFSLLENTFSDFIGRDFNSDRWWHLSLICTVNSYISAQTVNGENRQPGSALLWLSLLPTPFFIHLHQNWIIIYAIIQGVNFLDYFWTPSTCQTCRLKVLLSQVKPTGNVFCCRDEITSCQMQRTGKRLSLKQSRD